jgi:hypothetical protein
MLDRPVHIPCFFHVLGGSMHILVLGTMLCRVAGRGQTSRDAFHRARTTSGRLELRSLIWFCSQQPDTGRMESKRLGRPCTATSSEAVERLRQSFALFFQTLSSTYFDLKQY